jgi:hypothetical protein
MILVITHTLERNEYDAYGRLIAEKGSVWVSHGVDTETGKTVILPGDKWKDFQHNCVLYEGEWYLK